MASVASTNAADAHITTDASTSKVSNISQYLIIGYMLSEYKYHQNTILAVLHAKSA